jgi:hypothetical protein
LIQMLLLFLAVTTLAVAAYFAGEVVTQPSQDRRRAVKRAADYGAVRGAVTGLERLRFHERVIAPSAASLARIVLRLSPKLTVEATAARLLEAGLGRKLTPTTFLATKGAGALLAGFLGLVLGGSAGGAAAGFFSPSCSASAASSPPASSSGCGRGSGATRSGRSFRTRSICSPCRSRRGSASTAPWTS